MNALAPKPAAEAGPAVHLEFIQNQAGLPENDGLEAVDAYHRAVFMHHHARDFERFQQQARIELKLDNFHPVCARVEEVRQSPGFDGVVSRAFAELADFVRLSGHLLAPGGRLYAMKGVYPHEEIARLPEGFALAQALELTVPGLDAHRHLIIIERTETA